MKILNLKEFLLNISVDGVYKIKKKKKHVILRF